MPMTAPQTTGFDAPVFEAKDDHLSRWPLARQIYNVAANGPADWSARIGVYGEWGTGKTSVLKFVSSMAEADGHIVVWFDPWEFSNKTEMWRSYVRAVYEEVEAKLGRLAEGDAVRRAELINKVGGVVAKIAGLWTEQATGLANDGLELVKQHLSSHTEDLAKVRHVLNGKRVFVFVDDLDRTAAELVPEILYALKEVMDIPGFSFICGFDPVVVGKVLRASHLGFGDGLKFLEKIIDYPIWLPPATPEGLMKIALADTDAHCDFVPADEMRAIVPLLPPNPRAIRQFIRLQALLKTEVERYHPFELKWSLILAASAIKVRFPRLAPQLLNNHEFWRGAAMTQVMATQANKKEADSLVKEHVSKIEANQSLKLKEEERTQVLEGLRLILSSLNYWGDVEVESVINQVSIGEGPRAVTLKEFDDYLEAWAAQPVVNTLKSWITNHAIQRRCPEIDVAGEFSELAITRYCRSLDQADNAFTEQQKRNHRKQANRLLKLLESLVMELGDLKPSLESLDWVPLRKLVEDLVHLANNLGAVHRELISRTERLLMRLVSSWKGELEPLQQAVRSVHPLRSILEGKEARRVADKLNELLDKRLGGIAADGLSQMGFVESVSYRMYRNSEMHGIMLDVSGALWKVQRKKALQTLRRARSFAAIRGNAHSLLIWIELLLRSDHAEERKRVEHFVAEREIMSAVWNAATAEPFTGIYAYRLRDLPAKAKALGVELRIPGWWQPSIDRAFAGYEKKAAQKEPVEAE